MDRYNSLIKISTEVLIKILPKAIITEILLKYIFKSKLVGDIKDKTWTFDSESSMICIDDNVYVAADIKQKSPYSRKIFSFFNLKTMTPINIHRPLIHSYCFDFIMKYNDKPSYCFRDKLDCFFVMNSSEDKENYILSDTTTIGKLYAMVQYNKYIFSVSSHTDIRVMRHYLYYDGDANDSSISTNITFYNEKEVPIQLLIIKSSLLLVTTKRMIMFDVNNLQCTMVQEHSKNIYAVCSNTDHVFIMIDDDNVNLVVNVYDLHSDVCIRLDDPIEIINIKNHHTHERKYLMAASDQYLVVSDDNYALNIFELFI